MAAFCFVISKQVLVCKDVLEDDLRASAAPAPMMAAPSALDMEKVSGCDVGIRIGRMEGFSLQ